MAGEKPPSRLQAQLLANRKTVDDQGAEFHGATDGARLLIACRRRASGRGTTMMTGTVTGATGRADKAGQGHGRLVRRFREAFSKLCARGRRGDRGFVRRRPRNERLIERKNDGNPLGRGRAAVRDGNRSHKGQWLRRWFEGIRRVIPQGRAQRRLGANVFLRANRGRITMTGPVVEKCARFQKSTTERRAASPPVAVGGARSSLKVW